VDLRADPPALLRADDEVVLLAADLPGVVFSAAVFLAAVFLAAVFFAAAFFAAGRELESDR